MPLLNGLLFLMLLLAGFATAMILHDLKMREDEACARLEELHADRLEIHTSQNRMRPSGRGSDRLLKSPVKPDPHVHVAVRRTEFLDIDERKAPIASNPSTMQVSFDFALTCEPSVNRTTNRYQGTCHADTSCCA